MTDALLGSAVIRSDVLAANKDEEAAIKEGARSPRATAAVAVDTLPSLTGLRGLAALMVVYYHGGLGPHQDAEFPVLLFFVLSGFLMGYLYFSRPADGANLLRYACARAGRVFPIYLLLVIGFEALPTLWCTDGPSKCYQGWDVLQMMSFYHISIRATRRLGHSGAVMYWTVPVEVQFYVVFALVWWLSQSTALAGRLKRAIFGVVGLAYLGAVLKLFYGNPGMRRWSWLPFGETIAALPLPGWLVDESGICYGNQFCIASYVHVFAIGSFLGANWNAHLKGVCDKVPAILVEAIAAVCLVLCVVPLRRFRIMHGLELAYPGSAIRRVDWRGMTTFSTTFVDPASVAVTIGLIITCAHGAKTHAILRTRFFQFAGQISYGMYLINMHVFDFTYDKMNFESKLVNKVVGASIAVTVVYAIAASSFFFFEAPVQAWVRSFASSPRAALALFAGYLTTISCLYIAIELVS